MIDLLEKRKLKLFVIIVDHDKGEKISEIISKLGVMIKLIMLGHGTASSKVLDYLGLGKTDKDVLVFTAEAEYSKAILELIREKLKLDETSGGIGFTMPINGVGGAKTLEMLIGNESLNNTLNKEINMETKSSFDLIITIINRGFSDDVIVAAMSKGAEGGTVIHARGTGVHETEKFFGISIQPEKELVLILTPRYKKAEIISEICEKAGLSTPGKGICFSLPVDDVVGIVHLLKEQQLK